MLVYGLPILYALVLWWFATGAILYVVGLSSRTYRWSMLVATVVLAASLVGLAASAGDTSVSGAYLSFTYGILIWGWHEMAFLTGFVTGPRKIASPHGCRGWRQFGFAIQTILYHECAIILTAAVVAGLTWGGANQVGMWTFMVLWWMRLSAKLNIFLGAPNIPENFLAPHLAYLKSYFRRRSMNPFFPVAIVVSSVVAALLIERALSATATPFEVVSYVFIASFLVLAILEHWFLVLPISVDTIWRWGLRSHKRADTGAIVDATGGRLVCAPSAKTPKGVS